MTYIPKSKLNVLDTPGGEFISKLSGESYGGKYIELSSGKYYAGSDPLNLNEELIKPTISPLLTSNRNSLIYSNLKPKKAKFLGNIKSIYPTKNTPTEKDYDRGYYTRYFVKKVNEPEGYMEVSINIFNSIKQQKKEYDFHLYEIGSLTWNLKNGTRKSNFINLQILERTFKFVSIIFPVLNEFEIIDDVLTTPGGELYYKSGGEYIGPYHLHEGIPMVGAEHTEEPHATLYYREDLQDPNQPIKDYLDQTLFETPTQQSTQQSTQQQVQQIMDKAQNMTEAPVAKSPPPSSTRGGGSYK